MIYLVSFTRQIEADSSEQAKLLALDIIHEQGTDCLGVTPDDLPY